MKLHIQDVVNDKNFNKDLKTKSEEGYVWPSIKEFKQTFDKLTKLEKELLLKYSQVLIFDNYYSELRWLYKFIEKIDNYMEMEKDEN